MGEVMGEEEEEVEDSAAVEGGGVKVGEAPL